MISLGSLGDNQARTFKTHSAVLTTYLLVCMTSVGLATAGVVLIASQADKRHAVSRPALLFRRLCRSAGADSGATTAWMQSAVRANRSRALEQYTTLRIVVRELALRPVQPTQPIITFDNVRH